MNHSGQLGSGTRDGESTFSAIDTTGMEILAVACGREHSMLLVREEEDPGNGEAGHQNRKKQPNLLFAFGNSMYGQLGLGGSKDSFGQELAGEQVAGFVFETSPTAVQLPNPEESVVQVECGLDHTVLRTGERKMKNDAILPLLLLLYTDYVSFLSIRRPRKHLYDGLGRRWTIRPRT